MPSPRALSWFLLSGLALAACAQETPPDGTNTVTPEEEDSDPPQGPEGSSQCDSGFHACGATCIADSSTNDRPDLGCALGCGQACETPAHGVATCTEDGVCAFECEDGYARVDGKCVVFACEAQHYACGTFIDQAGTSFDCGGCYGTTTCGANHQCTIAADTQEPNNTKAQAKSLGTFDDADDLTRWVDDLAISSSTDEDWFSFKVVDGFDAGNPDATIQLTTRGSQNGWLASTHELTVWFKCDAGDNGSSVSCGEWYTTDSTNTLHDAALGTGCTVNKQYLVWGDVSPSCVGLTDSGTVTVRVRKTTVPSGDPYDLFVSVD